MLAFTFLAAAVALSAQTLPTQTPDDLELAVEEGRKIEFLMTVPEEGYAIVSIDGGEPIEISWDDVEWLTELEEIPFDDHGPVISGSDITNIYPLPFHSGQRYQATTYNGHGSAWDFNLAGADGGEPITAVTNGRVVAVVSNYDYNNRGCKCFGNYVKIDHDGDSYYSVYGHMRTVHVSSGQWVEKGQAIGTIGNTGDSSGDHLHFEIQDSGGVTHYPRFWYEGNGQEIYGYLSANGWYTSTNNGKITSAWTRTGGFNVGWRTRLTSDRVAYEGFSQTYTGGIYGTCAIYYQALGCRGGDYCPQYNNTNVAWLVRSGFYNYYFNCGGPAYCWLGFPTSDEYSYPEGSRQNFQNGWLWYHSWTGQITAHRY